MSVLPRQHNPLTVSFYIAMLLGALMSPVTALAEDAAQAGEAAQVETPTAQAPARQDAVCDAKGRLRRVERRDGGFVEYFYHPTLNKISAVVTNEVSTVYTYDRAGNLTRIFNTRDQLVTLEYDRENHISHMLQTVKGHPEERRALAFRYNRAGKPVFIRMAGVGTIRVRYDAASEIEKVESPQGAKMALEVIRAFQILMKMVKIECDD